MLRLYCHRFCPHSRCVRIALAELGCTYEAFELAPEERHPVELVGLTPRPYGVPVLLVQDGFALWDSTSILHWLTGSFRGSITPNTRDERAKATAWVGWAARTLYWPLGELSGSIAQKAAGERRLREVLADLEPMMPVDDTFLVGGTFSVADIALSPPLVALHRSLVDALPPRVRRYIERLRHRPSVFEVCELGEVGARPSLCA